MKDNFQRSIIFVGGSFFSLNFLSFSLFFKLVHFIFVLPSTLHQCKWLLYIKQKKTKIWLTAAPALKNQPYFWQKIILFPTNKKIISHSDFLSNYLESTYLQLHMYVWQSRTFPYVCNKIGILNLTSMYRMLSWHNSRSWRCTDWWYIIIIEDDSTVSQGVYVWCWKLYRTMKSNIIPSL